MPKAGAFLGVFFVVMVIGYGFLYYVDFVPEAPEEANTASEVVNTAETIATTTPSVDEAPEADSAWGDPFPVSITIDRLGKTIPVLNPSSRFIADLDKALLNGVVRHPDSGDLNDTKGNMLILGHSSYLKNVFNKNYQAFNDIQKLVWGDTIRLRSRDMEYVYRVDKVYEAKASAVSIPTASTEQKLTLATCDTLGAKEDRFIVEATLISKKAL